jgi:hypothetical protein
VHGRSRCRHNEDGQRRYTARNDRKKRKPKCTIRGLLYDEVGNKNEGSKFEWNGKMTEDGKSVENDVIIHRRRANTMIFQNSSLFHFKGKLIFY